jgi:hypothetical protein
MYLKLEVVVVVPTAELGAVLACKISPYQLKSQAVVVTVLDHSAQHFVYGRQVARPEKLIGKIVVLPEIDFEKKRVVSGTRLL